MGKNQKLVIALWFLVGPLAASLANNALHPLRSLTWIPIPQLIVAWGEWQILTWLFSLSKEIKYLAAAGSFIVVLSAVLYWGDIYFLHFPISQSEFWQYGMKQIALDGWKYRNDYDKIVVDSKFGSEGPFNVGIPYAYFLFYGKYDPAQFQRRTLGANFDKFEFRDIYWPVDRKVDKTLYIGSPWVLPTTDLANNHVKDRIYFKNGREAFVVAESDQ